jgi:hypothetical protein
MSDEPALHRYQTTDRADVFDLLRASLPQDASARLIAQWAWKYETSPCTPLDGPVGYIIRVGGGKLVGLSAGFRLKMWMGGIECVAESWGDWVVHPDYRRRKLWERLGFPLATLPIVISWGRSFSPRYGARMGWTASPLTPLIRVLNAGPLIQHFTHSRLLASIGIGASAVARAAGAPLRRWRGRDSDSTIALDAFDDRADALWEQARRPDRAMVVRDRRYLTWRYCQRPDATYNLLGFQRGSELAGFLVIRMGTHQGMRWGYLVDFLAPENSTDILSSLIEHAIVKFRDLGVTAVSCYVTDAAARRALFRHGFFPAPQRDPIHFSHLLPADRLDLRKFATLSDWYVTMGDSDFEMAF